MPSPVGYNRVYVHLEKGFGFRQWFQALKEGRSFATNGPVLFFTVNNHEPGDTISIGPGTTGSTKHLTIHAEARSAGQLDRLEVVWKGHVVKRIQAANNSSTIDAVFEFDAKESGWLIARTFEKPAPTFHFAQTNPVFVRVDDDPGVVSEDARFFIDWIDRETNFFENSTGFQDEADRKAMLALVRQARSLYERLATKALPKGRGSRADSSQ